MCVDAVPEPRPSLRPISPTVNPSIQLKRATSRRTRPVTQDRHHARISASSSKEGGSIDLPSCPTTSRLAEASFNRLDRCSLRARSTDRQRLNWPQPPRAASNSSPASHRPSRPAWNKSSRSHEGPAPAENRIRRYRSTRATSASVTTRIDPGPRSTPAATPPAVHRRQPPASKGPTGPARSPRPSAPPHAPADRAAAAPSRAPNGTPTPEGPADALQPDASPTMPTRRVRTRSLPPPRRSRALSRQVIHRGVVPQRRTRQTRTKLRSSSPDPIRHRLAIRRPMRHRSTRQRTQVHLHFRHRIAQIADGL